MGNILDQNCSDDICYSHHRGDTASVLAHDKAALGKQEMYETLKALFRQHPMGLTSHEIAELLGLPNRNQFAPRLSEMKAAGILRESGEHRNGCHVLKMLTKFF